MLVDQFFDDQGNGAALQAGDAGEIGCRVRIRLSTMRRLMSRTTSLEAPRDGRKSIPGIFV
jgi:hypothetical protein